MANFLAALLVEFQTNPHGMTAAFYSSTREFIARMLNEDAATFFSAHVDATDGAFYIKEDVDLDELFNGLFEFIEKK